MYLCALLVSVCACCIASASQTIPATAAIWQGRTLRNGDSVSFSWEGVQASFTVTGASTVVATIGNTLKTATSFHAYVDQAYVGVVYSGGGDGKFVNATIATGLSPSEPHTIVLWYIIDPIALSWPVISPGFLTIASFSTDGTFGAPPPQLFRRLQIVGDSITAGNQINNSTCQPDHSGTYEALLCSSFGANCTTLAISGFGLFENCCTESENITMATLVSTIIPSDLSTVWDDSAFVPDAVLINLGTNDNARNNGTQQWIDDFVATYVDFLVNLTITHGNNKDLPIFCSVGPITHAPEPWVMEAMSQAEALGLSNLHFINYTTPVDKCGHPDYASHVLMYEQARPIVSKVLGWA